MQVEPSNDKYDNSVTGLIWMLNGNINDSRKEVLDALQRHEEKEMEEINAIKKEIAELQTWKWRGIVVLGALFFMGLLNNGVVEKLLHIGGLA